MSTYFKLGHLIEGIEPIVTAGGNTVLTVSSKPIQRFTGTSAQTVTLPDATTLPNNRRFDINNRSTQDVTVNANGGGLVAVVPAGSQRAFVVTDISSAAGSWSVYGITGGGGSGSGVEIEDKLKLLAGMAGLNLSTENIEARVLKTNVEEMGGNYWTTKAPLLRNTRFVGATTLNGFIYAIGGDDVSSFFNFNDRYNDDSNYFLGRQTMITPRRAHAAFTLSGKNYAALGSTTGGSRTNLAEAYTDSTNTWAAVTALTTPLQNMTNGLVVDDYGYTVGGEANGATITDAVNMYNAVANAWYPRSVIPASRMDLQGASVDGNLFVFAGLDSSFNRTTTNYRFAPLTNSWTTKTALPVTRSGGCAFAAFDKIMAVAGYDGAAKTYVYEYGTSTDFWRLSSNIQTARYDMSNSGGNLNGFGYAWGGSGVGPVIASVESYTPHSMISVGPLKKSTAVPTSILVGTLSNALASELPVQIRTDGNNWKSFLSGSDSVLKLDETLAGKLQYSPELYWAGGSGGSTLNNRFDDNANAWTARQALPIGAQSGSSFAIDGYGFSLYATGTELATQQYNSITNTWATRASVLDENEYGTDGVGWTLNGIGYYAGGESLDASNDSLQSYNNATNAWTQKTNTTNPHRRAVGFGLFNSLGFCGNSIVGLTTNMERYNPITNSWANAADITNRRDNAAGGNLEDKGYVIGGSSNGASANAQDSIYEYNHNLNSWSTKTTTGYNVMFFGAQYSQDNIFWAGGLDSGGSALGSTRRFNPLANTVTTRTALTTASTDNRPHPSGPYLNYEVRVGVPAFYAGVGSWVTVTKAASPATLAAFGFGIQNTLYAPRGDAGGGGVGVAGVYAYDVEKDSWRQTGDSTYTAAYTGSLCLYDFGYRFGGRIAGPTYLNTTSRFNPVTQQWSSSATLPGSIGYAAGAPLNGFGYSLGGFNGGIVSSVYRYNPSTNAWAAAGNLSTARYSLDAESASGFIYLGGNVDANFEQYNDVTQSTVFKTAIPHLNSDGAALSKGDKFYYFRGGSDAVQEYDTQGNYWAAKPTISARYYIAGARFGNNFQLAGGSTGLTTNEAYVDSIKNAVLGLALEVK